MSSKSAVVPRTPWAERARGYLALARISNSPTVVSNTLAGAALGIRVGKIQLSCALKVPLPEDAGERNNTALALRQFADSTYLHQVIQRNRDGSFVHYPDLPDALPAIVAEDAAEWRVHVHVPIFVDRYATFGSTQDELRRVLALVRERRLTPHLEIETYAWDVLPQALKADLLESIGREYTWALDVF